MSIDCILSLRDESGNYYVNTYITLLSLLENTQSQVNIHIFHDDTIKHAVAPLTELVERFGQQIFFHTVPQLEDSISKKLQERFSTAATYRLYALETLEMNKAIYLDSDLIIQRDIKELADTDIDNNLVAAVKNIGGLWRSKKKAGQYKSTIDFLGLKEETYFNSGVLYMNLKNIRAAFKGENVFLKRMLAAVEAGIALPYPDQDVLNSVWQVGPDAIKWLDESFNYLAYARGRLGEGLDATKGKIVHYAGTKPWSSFFPIHLPFWYYYAKSPFQTDMFNHIDKAMGSDKMEFMRNYAMYPKYRSLGSAVLKSGLRGIVSR